MKAWTKQDRFAAITAVIAVMLMMVTIFLVNGCAVLKGTAAPVNETITEVIADADTVAIQAEQMYQAGTIPQTTAARTAINDLGGAYNDAKVAFSLVLTAQAAYNGAQAAQVTACAPPSTSTQANAAECTAATATAAARQATLTAAQSALSTQVSALVTKTTAVKVFTTPK
jgi:hypothetical protein